MRRLGPLLAVLCAVPLAGLTPAHAQDDPPFDGAAIAGALADDPIHVLPGAPARFDEATVRAELRRADDATAGAVYVVVAPIGRSEFDVRKPVEPRLGPDDVLIVVAGLQVTTDWYSFAGGEYTGEGPEGKWDVALNTRHAPTVLRTYDVTAPLADILRLARHAGFAAPTPVPERVAAPTATVDALARELADDRLAIDPSLLTGPDAVRTHVPYEAEDFATHRIAVLPPAEPGRPVPDPLPGLANRFPEDTVVVVRGLWLDAAGPGSQEAMATSLRYARDATHDSLLWQGTRLRTVSKFYERMDQIRRGVLDPRGIPVKPPSAEETGSTLGPWAFALTGLAIAGASAGGWWWRRRLRKRAEQRAIRLASAELTADLARLAAAIVGVPSAAAGGQNRRRAEAAERYATAVDLAEQATTSAELNVASDVVRQAHDILERAR